MSKKKRKTPIIEAYTGILSKHKKGFGFVVIEDEKNDIFIDVNNINTAMNGDKVQVELIPMEWVDTNSSATKAHEGIITKIVERNYKEVVGTFDKGKSYGFLVPDEAQNSDDIFVSKGNQMGANNGDKVVVQITKYPTKQSKAEGKVIEIIAQKGEIGGAIKALIRSNGLTEEFSQEVEQEASEAASRAVKREDIAGRRDLREEIVVTIDGADAKDLDDAISIRKNTKGNYILGVHIADVSHYVTGGGLLDREALTRGNSTYLLTKVVPMLPKSLSNGICSLNPNVDRLTLSCEMEISKEGDIVNHHIFESVIRSQERLIYDDISDILENNDQSQIERYSHIIKEISLMDELAKILRKKRKDKGSLDFDVNEAHIQLDEKERPISVEVADRRTANKLIEEFMLIANEVVAEHFFWMELPFVYRVHEKPEIEKLTKLKAFLNSFGITLSNNIDNIHPKLLQDILTKIEGREYQGIVSSVMLRSMKKANYSTECQGHYGLSFKYYCHFTSPIRRYPDLMIHRIIKASIRGELNDKLIRKFKKKAEKVAKISSLTERKSQEMEREVEKMKKAEYLRNYIGEEFEGVISGITNFGIYIELPNTIEGMVRLESLRDDYYDYEETRYRVIGRNKRKIYALGDRARIKVIKVDIENKNIDFKILD